MITITTTNATLKTKAEQIMQHEILHNPNLNGSEYQIELGEYNSIDGADEITGTQLHIQIFSEQEC